MHSFCPSFLHSVSVRKIPYDLLWVRMLTLCNETITLSAILFVLPAEKSFHGSIAFSSFIHFISSSLQVTFSRRMLLLFSNAEGSHWFQWKQCVDFTTVWKSNIFRTMHLCIILVGNQLDTQFLMWYIYLNPLHVLSILCSSSGGQLY